MKFIKVFRHWPLKSLLSKMSLYLFCYAGFLFIRCILNPSISSRMDENMEVESYKSPKQRWFNEVKSRIVEKGFYEILPLFKRLNQTYNETDPALLDIIRENYLIRPPLEGNGAYWNINIESETSMGQAQIVYDIYRNSTKPYKGFFVECGALDGVLRSNTLTLERKHGWRGVLIEADPENLINLLGKRRRSWVVPACLSTQKETMNVPFRAWGNIGSIVDNKQLPKDNLEKQNMTKILDVTCLPFYAILTAMEQSQVDYLSLDVEGNELDILKTIPFDKINVKVISVEFSHGGEKGDGKESLRNYMESMGFRTYAEVVHPENLANDFIFVRDSIFEYLQQRDKLEQQGKQEQEPKEPQEPQQEQEEQQQEQEEEQEQQQEQQHPEM